VLPWLQRIFARASANPESGHFRKSGQVQFWPNFEPDLPDLADANAAAVYTVYFGKKLTQLTCQVAYLHFQLELPRRKKYKIRCRSAHFVKNWQTVMQQWKHWTLQPPYSSWQNCWRHYIKLLFYDPKTTSPKSGPGSGFGRIWVSRSGQIRQRQ